METDTRKKIIDDLDKIKSEKVLKFIYTIVHEISKDAQSKRAD